VALTYTIGPYDPLYVTAVSTDYKPQGELKALTPPDWTVISPAWTADGKEIIFVRGGGGNVGGDTAMYRVSSDGSGPPRRIQFAGDNPWFLSVARQGHRMAFTRMHRDANIYRLGIGSDGVIHGPGERIASSSRFDVGARYSPDGTRIALFSNRGGASEIWVTQADGRNPVQLTNSKDPDTTASPSWSPDSTKIAYVALGQSKTTLSVCVMPAGGGPSRAIAENVDKGSTPTWSHDGHSIYFSRSSNMWKVSAGGGTPVQVTRDAGIFAQESPDGKWLYYRTPNNIIRRMPAAGGDSTEFAQNAAAMWVSTRGVYFFFENHYRAQDWAIRFLPHAGGEPKVIGSVQQRILPYISVSPDERFLVYSQYDQAAAELMLVENFR
jgi:Tol biopolymer transport system component